MIFQHTWQAVLSGDKTQTRRVVKPGERLLTDQQGRPWVDMALNGLDRRKWCIGRTYAVQPGRGKKAVGRIRITGIRQERVNEIGDVDAIAEGIELWRCQCNICEGRGFFWGTPLNGNKNEPCSFCTGTGWKASPIKLYAELWDTIHGAGSFDAGPEVWVLEFELVEGE